MKEMAEMLADKEEEYACAPGLKESEEAFTE